MAYLQFFLYQELLTSTRPHLTESSVTLCWFSLLGGPASTPWKTSIHFDLNKHWEQTDPNAVATLLTLCSALPGLSLPHQFLGRNQILVQYAH